MGGFFSTDGLFYRFGSMLFDVMYLSMLWLMFSLPLITIGPATTALFYVATRRIKNKEGYIFQDFWKSFKSNFKTGMLAGVLLFFITGFLIFEMFIMEDTSAISSIFFPAQCILLIELFFINIHIYPLLSRFDMKFVQLFKTAFFFSNRHLLTSVTCLALAAGCFVAVFVYPFLIFFAMGVYAFLASYMLIRIYRKYKPEIDPDFVDESGNKIDSGWKKKLFGR